MRMIMAIDEAAKVSYSNNMPACMRWAQRRAAKTGNTVKILLGRPGCKEARIFAEATPEGLRAIHAGRAWKWKRLERNYEQEK